MPVSETRSDRRFQWRWSALALFLLGFPYLVLFLVHPAHALYSGVIFNPNDAYFYFAQMLHGHDGAWIFTNYFTYRQQAPIAIHWFYHLLGHLTPGVPDPLATSLAWHVSRLVLAAIFLSQLWALLGELLPGRASRRVAFLFVVFTSGVAAYQAGLLAGAPGLGGAGEPFDLKYAESSTFFELLFAPHFAAVMLLLVIYLRGLYRAVHRGSAGGAAVAGVAMLLLSTIHPDKPLTLALAVTLLLGWLGWRRRLKLRQMVLAGLTILPGLPYPVFMVWLSGHNPQFNAFLGQDNFIPPGVLGYALGYGIPGLLALSGLPRLLRRRGAAGDGEALLWALAVAGLALALIPASMVPRKSVEGVQLALAALAGRNMVHLAGPRLWRGRAFAAAAQRRLFGYSRRRLRLLSINLAVILSSTTVMALSLAAPRAALVDAPELYLTRDDRVAVSWLRDHSRPQQVVAGSEETGQFVAAYAGDHVVFGQFQWTPRVGEEHQALITFLGRDRGSGCAEDPNSDPRSYLLSREVSWLYYGPRERRCDATASAIHPAQADFLLPAFQAGNTVIYRVRR
ncbi:MAG TPA: hypothetical protein VN863_03690 [Candidatus Dormibacteraeota bacterium]|nr:hypothetical protein [Candidatus Dormibacteraeota bacterium]